MDLNIIWFILIGVLLTGYAILDGFDLGAGMLHVFVKEEADRKRLLQSIAPFWDGNEVWLITGCAGMFAAFPHAYATVFSGFYLAVMLLLVGLVFRGLSIECRNQVDTPGWKLFWDRVFSLSSLLVTLLLGVALGNIFTGLPIDAEMNYTGSFFTLLRPLPLVVGLTGVVMVTTQGASFLLLKTEGAFQVQAGKWVVTSWRLFVAFSLITFAVTLVTTPTTIGLLFDGGLGVGVALLWLGSVGLLPVFLKRQQYRRVFVSSSLVILAMFLIVGVTIFPNMVPAQIPQNSLTIYNSSSSPLTLQVMLIIALIGMPLVLAYTIYVYRVFRK